MKRKCILCLAFFVIFSLMISTSDMIVIRTNAKPVELPQRPLENPEYLKAKNHPHWCGTMEVWNLNKKLRGTYRTTAETLSGCMEGNCDIPEVRDETSTDLKRIRVLFHAIHKSDGTEGVSQATIDATLDQMNADYAPYNIKFVSAGTRHHNSDEHYCIAGYGIGPWWNDIAAMKDAYAESPETQCNIYISCQNFSPFGSLLGLATFPWDTVALTNQGGIWLNNIAMGAGAHIATHEIGHCLGLWHTHHGVTEVTECGDCYEYANGFECDIRGDFACTTPPTPVNYTCNPPGGQDCWGDPWGMTQPENYMSYGPDECVDTFTDQQMLRKHCWTQGFLPGWICDVESDFTGTPTSGCSPLTVNFLDQSTGPVNSWLWEFGDGYTSTAQFPSHEYSAPGIYDVSLTVSSVNCSDTETKTDFITISSSPMAEFSGNPTIGCLSLEVNFSDQSAGNPSSWDWDFGDGTPHSYEQNPTHTYNTPGNYTVTLITTNNCGQDVEAKNDYIHIDPTCSTKSFAQSENTVAGERISGNYIDTHASDNIYEILREKSSGGKPSSRYSRLDHRWEFNIPPGSIITFSVEAFRPDNSDGDNFVFGYSTDNNSFTTMLTISSSTEQVYSASMPNTINSPVYIRVTDTDSTPGNLSLDEIYIDYMYIESSSGPVPPVAEFLGEPTSGFAPLTVLFTDLSSGIPTSWSWNFGDGSTSILQNPTHEYAAVGIYTVLLNATNAFGSDTKIKTGYITVTEPGQYMYINDIIVTKVDADSGGIKRGQAVVTVYDTSNQPVPNATVTGDFSGLTNETGLTNDTNGSGQATILTSGTMRGGSGEWCFEVTNVTHASLTYNPSINNVTKSCDKSGDIY